MRFLFELHVLKMSQPQCRPQSTGAHLYHPAAPAPPRSTTCLCVNPSLGKDYNIGSGVSVSPWLAPTSLAAHFMLNLGAGSSASDGW
jgi:hypothetical protein